MKVAFIIAHAGQTGVNQVVRHLAEAMVAHGHYCKVFYMQETDAAMEFGCNTCRWKGWGELSYFDIVHTHGLKPELLVARHRLSPFRKDRRLRFVTTLHNYCFQDLPDLYGYFKGFFLGLLFLATKLFFDKVVCLSKHMMSYYGKWFPQHKLTYAYNTTDILIEEFKYEDGELQLLQSLKEGHKLIGMHCVLIYRKGIDIMLNAMKLLPDVFRLVIVGSGKEENTFKRMAKDLDMEERVFFIGKKPNAYRYLPFYDIYAMPSRSEGFPIVLLEAAAYGTKVVASSLPAVKECFSDNEIVIFDMSDEHALADAIMKADSNEDLGNILNKRFEKDYSPSVFYQRYIRIYEL